MHNNEKLCLGIRKPHVGMFDRFVNDYVGVVRERIAAETERDAAWDEQDKLVYDYNQVVDKLMRTEDQLAEAAECVRLLIAWAAADMRHWTAETNDEEIDAIDDKEEAWGLLPAWMRRMIAG